MKKILIVGATSGIGKELAKIYSRQGWEVAIAGRRTELLDKLSEELPAKTYRLTLDVAKTEETKRSIEKLFDDIQGVDLVVINAGIGHLNDALNWEKEKETIETNVLGFAVVANAAMRHFLKKGTGHLVGISSIACLRGSHIAPAYNASKAFVSNYLEGLRVKVAKKNLPITVSDIRPGLVDTEMAKGEGLFWLAPPEKAANQIFQAIEKKREIAYVTKRWALIALLLKLMPNFLFKRM